MALARSRRRTVLAAALADLRQIRGRLDAMIAVVEVELLPQTRPGRSSMA